MITVYYAKQLRPLSLAKLPEFVFSDLLDKVAEVETDDLEVAFRAMNAVDGDELCCQLKVRSMSVGDVAVESDGTAWICAPCGWAQVKLVVVTEMTGAEAVEAGILKPPQA